MRFQHLTFLYVTTQVSYAVIRYVLLLKIRRDDSERVGTVSRRSVVGIVFKTFCVSAREEQKIAVKARSDRDIQGNEGLHSKKRHVGDPSKKKRE